MLCASAHEKCAPLHTVGVAVPLAVFQAALVAELRLCHGQLVVPCGDGSLKVSYDPVITYGLHLFRECNYSVLT